MFTTVDKAIAGVVLGGLFLLQNVAHIGLGLSPDTVNTILGLATPILVYLIPNKTKQV